MEGLSGGMGLTTYTPQQKQVPVSLKPGETKESTHHKFRSGCQKENTRSRFAKQLQKDGNRKEVEDESQGTTLLQQICEAQQRATGYEWNATVQSACAGDKLFVLCNGLVCRLPGGNQVALVVPDDDVLCSNLLTKYHDSPMAGQLEWYRMTHALAKCHWQKGMYHDCQQHVHACKVYQAAKVSTQKLPWLF